MTVILKNCTRLASAAGTGLVLAAALPALAWAQTQAQNPAPSAKAPVSATAGQVVTRDAETGALRAPTAEELQALESKAGASRSPGAAARNLSKVHVSGAQGARLTDESMTYSVAVRRADGSLAHLHFASKSEAEAALKAPAALIKNTTAATE